jgi:large subunit ribosomal protein L5
MESRLYKKYKEEIIPALKEEFGYKNIMQVPKIEKVVINVGYGKHNKEAAYIENVENTLKAITGQKPVRNKVSKSISNFKIREGANVGSSVILRGKRMYDFLDKLVNVSLPRVRDFRGISPKSFDRNGNYTLGFKENISFPEIKSDAIDKIHGLEVVVCTTALKDKEAKSLLTKVGFPFKAK